MAVRITKRLFTKRWRGVITAMVCALLAATQLPLLKHSEAQATRPTLISEESSTRAVAVESITRKREPFSPRTEVSWGSDNRTRIILFVVGFELMPGETSSVITAQAEFAGKGPYPLEIEYVGKVPNFDSFTQVNLKLPNELANAGDVLVSLSLRGVISNKVVINVK